MDKEFIEFLKLQIGEKSLGQIEIITGLTKSYLSKLLRGITTKPKPETLKKLSKALPCSYEDLMIKAGYTTETPPLQKENTIRIIGRGGVIKEYKVTDEQQKAFETLLATLPKDDPDLKF